MHAVLWGLGRTLALEYPEIWGGVIDVDESMPAVLAARLVRDEASIGDGEDHVGQVIHRALFQKGMFEIIKENGEWVTGVAVFAAAYERVGLRRMAWLSLGLIVLLLVLLASIKNRSA